jgi:fumarate reductase flavoprotein subunit
MGVGDTNPAFNLTWQDWMNLRNLLLVSKTVVVAALARENSRGAHYREDFPEEGDLDTSYYTAVRLVHDQIQIDKKPVVFSMVKPGETILVEA